MTNTIYWRTERFEPENVEKYRSIRSRNGMHAFCPRWQKHLIIRIISDKGIHKK